MSSPATTAFYKGKRILVTGGTGSIGSEIVRQLLACEPAVVRVLSRDDSKQAELQQRLGPNARMRYLIGDVRDRERTTLAMERIDVVFHAAAMKHVPTCEYNPFEAAQTNVVGTQHVIQAALSAGVKRVVVISTDKAVNPVNTMGASKLMAERMAVACDLWARDTTRLCAVRFGNVVGSRGSLVPIVAGQVERGEEVTVTDPRMTRFLMTIADAVGLVLEAGAVTEGGEVFILKMPAVRVGDLIQAIVDAAAARCGKDPASVRTRTVGIRPGEKMDEELLTTEEVPRTVDRGAMFAVLPPHRISEIRAPVPADAVGLYHSGKAAYLDQAALRDLLTRSGL